MDDNQRELLRVFLEARGNTKELERHLGVSYPTARARLEELLAALGITTKAPDRPADRKELLAAVAHGDVAIDEALDTLNPRNSPRTSKPTPSSGR